MAEDITSRFLNVISLFNRAVPLIAIQLRGLEVGGVFTVYATKVLDLTSFPVEEEEADLEATVDRAHWEKGSNKKSVALADRLVTLTHEVTGDDSLALKYNKYYIGLARHGVPDNFVTMRPRRPNMVAHFRIPCSMNCPSA